jgi:long-chain acyl-CoA synthetase
MISLFLNRLLKLFRKEKENKPWYNLYDVDVKPSLDYPDGSIYDSFVECADKYPSLYAYRYFGTKVKFKNFKNQVDRCARALKNIGVKANDNVTICMPNTPEAVIMFYALNAVGAIANMIHPLSSEKEIEFYLNKGKSKYMLCLDLVYPKVMKIIQNTSVKEVIVASVDNSMPIILKCGYNLTKNKIKLQKDKTIKWSNFYNLGKKRGIIHT